jgi:hypothetical protein
MSATSFEAVGEGIPRDNVQYFERLRENGEMLQTMADLQEDVDTINTLTAQLELDQLLGLPVEISGGSVQVPALVEDDLETQNSFMPNQQGVTGEYHGVSWREIPSTFFPGQREWRLCHRILTGQESYFDEQGWRHKIENFTYVTLPDAEVEIISQAGSHDFRRLASDGFSLKLDEVVLDESMDLSEKLDLIARMFGKFQSGENSGNTSALRLQRLSYLNHLGLFSNSYAVTPFAYLRDADGSTMVLSNAHAGNIGGIVRMVGFDFPMVTYGSDKHEIQTETQILCLELEIDGYGLTSAPYVPGETRLYALGG